MLSRAVFLYGTRSFVSQRPRNLDLQWVRKWKSELLAVAWCERLRLRSAVCGDFPPCIAGSSRICTAGPGDPPCTIQARDLSRVLPKVSGADSPGLGLGLFGRRSIESYLVDPASSHMLVSKIKPCMSKYKPH